MQLIEICISLHINKFYTIIYIHELFKTHGIRCGRRKTGNQLIDLNGCIYGFGIFGLLYRSTALENGRQTAEDSCIKTI